MIDVKAIRALVDPVARRVRMSISRAVLTLISDEDKRQMVQLEALKGEIKEQVERMQNYGFTSVPMPGAQAVLVCVGGNRDHPIVIVADDPRGRKIGLQPGEVAVYTNEGDYIHLKRGNKIELKTSTFTVIADEKVRMETPVLEVTGDIIDNKDSVDISMAGMRATYNSHTHPETNAPGGDTQAPNQRMGV